ncbi:hypothetical protein AGMMS49579_07540 [Spirochaetia bacterium]|nr:hypothetical protein AGMMS49579_07540 [Spirochaetia bacterium]
MIIGIDIGSTITKTVSIENGRMIRKIKTRAADAVTSAAGALGKLIIENDINIANVQGIAITGAGASKIRHDIFGISTQRIEEIRAIGIGGMFLAGEDHIIITNVGTGTAVIEAGKDGIFHLGGSGLGAVPFTASPKSCSPPPTLTASWNWQKRGT